MLLQHLYKVLSSSWKSESRYKRPCWSQRTWSSISMSHSLVYFFDSKLCRYVSAVTFGFSWERKTSGKASNYFCLSHVEIWTLNLFVCRFARCFSPFARNRLAFHTSHVQQGKNWFGRESARLKSINMKLALGAFSGGDNRHVTSSSNCPTFKVFKGFSLQLKTNVASENNVHERLITYRLICNINIFWPKTPNTALLFTTVTKWK